MQVSIKPSTGKGDINIPSSKSYTHRLLIASALSNDISYVDNVSLSDDINATISCLASLGYKCNKNENGYYFSNDIKTNEILDCHESGSTLRFFIPLALVKGGKFIFKGTPKLFSRGLDPYINLFNDHNIDYELGNDYLKINGKFNGGTYIIDAAKSSQYLTGLCLALPLAANDSKIIIKNNISSYNYLLITLDVLKKYHINYNFKDNEIIIFGNQHYYFHKEIAEIDYSNAAFLDALNLFGSNININNKNNHSLQSDANYDKYFEMLKNGTPTIDLDNNIDLGPILFCLASYFNGATFINTSRLKMKESNRIDDVLTELKKFNCVNYLVFDNKIIIGKNNLQKPSDILSSHNDHRIAMALSVLLTIFGGKIDNAEAVNKSYPNFYHDLITLGFEVEIND